MIGVSVRIDEATPLLERAQTEAQARGLALVGARAVGTLVKDHLYGLDSQRHRNGSHFYKQAADSVTTGMVPQGAVASVTQLGFRQRLQGGDIRAKNGRDLTIPACPEAEGKRAREFSDLDFGFAFDPETQSIRPALIRRPQTTIKLRRVKTDSGVTFRARPVASLQLQVMFWLTPKVHQEPDPTVLPHDEQMSAVALRAIQGRFERLVMRRAQNNSPEGSA